MQQIADTFYWWLEIQLHSSIILPVKAGRTTFTIPPRYTISGSDGANINPFLVVSDASPVDGRWTCWVDFYHVRYGTAERTRSAGHFRQRSICQIRLPTINRRYWGQHDGLALYPSIMQDCISTDRAHTHTYRLLHRWTDVLIVVGMDAVWWKQKKWVAVSSSLSFPTIQQHSGSFRDAVCPTCSKSFNYIH